MMRLGLLSMQRVSGACREALGLRQGRDPMDEVEDAAAEVRQRVEHLRREASEQAASTARVIPIRPRLNGR